MAALSDMSRQTRWLIGGLLCAVGVGLFYMQVWQANVSRITDLQDQIEILEAEIQQSQSVAASLPELEAQLTDLNEQLGILRHILPEERETDQLLRRVAAVAAESNLTIDNIAFEELVPHDFYAESPINLQLTGTYHNLAHFFDQIANFARIINVGEVSVRTLDDDPLNTVKASCVAMTFIFLEEGEEPEDSVDLEDGTALLAAGP